MCVVVGDHTRGTHVEVRGQPQMLVLAFHLVWSRSFDLCCILQTFPHQPLGLQIAHSVNCYACVLEI